MIARQKRLCMAGAIFTCLGIPLACASSGENDGKPGEQEAGTDPIVSSDSGATTDRGAEAGACSTSKLCISSLSIGDETNLTSVWGSSGSDVWAVGSGGTVLHYDGHVWEKAERAAATDAAANDLTLHSVWLDRPDNIWIADGHNLRHTTGWAGPSATPWSFTPYSATDCRPMALHGGDGIVLVARNNPYCSSGSQIQRFDRWADVDGDGGPYVIPNPNDADLGLPLSIAVSRHDEAWVSTRARLSETEMANRIFRLSPSADSGEWQIEEYDSRARRAVLGMWGDEQGVWLVGEGGTLRHVLRSNVPTKRFDIVESPVAFDLRGIFGFGANDIWAVGEMSTVLHWDGTSWTKLATPLDDAEKKPSFAAVWGSSPGDVWIAGHGTMLHYQEDAQ